LAGARRNLKVVLRKQPQLFDALHLMGLVEAQRGHNKDAEVLLRQAVRINPASAEAHANRGNVQRALERFDDAIASYDQALQIRPSYANALNSRAIALTAVGRFAEALASYEQALAIDPNFAMAIYNRAITLVQLNRLEEAVAAFDQMLARDPAFAQGHVDRANALAALGRIDDALAAYDRAVAVDPRLTLAHYNRGLALLKAGRFADAVVSFDALLAVEPAVPGALDGKGNALAALDRHDEALVAFAAATQADPTFAAAFNNMGFVLLKLRRANEALAAFDKALRVDPQFVGALNNRGNALLALGRTDDAIASFGAALKFAPDGVDALANRASAALTARRYDIASADFERVVDRDPAHPYALGNLLYARMHCSDWRGFDDLQNRIRQGMQAGRKTILPFEAVACTESAADHRTAAMLWIDDVCPVRSSRPTTASRRRQKIRLAYLSPDLRTHPVAILLAELFERHDHSRFETHAFSFGANDRSELRARLERSFDAFHDVRELDDHAIAERMREREIDIVVDLTGFTENCRPGILALRPAPIQVNYLGYLGTMGAELVDYVIADRVALPDAIRAHIAERVAYLPDSLLVGDTTRPISASPPSRSALGLPETGVVFCAFHSRHKITPQLFEVWTRLLKAVEGSVLWLAGGSPQSNENLRREAQTRGIAPERLVVMPLVTKSEEYLARYTLADVFLDVLPYNAISTAVDALWAGLPIVTCAGGSFGGRGAGSALHAAGLPELVCTTLEAYEAAALKLASDEALRSELKNRLLRERARFALFDTDRFRRNIEAAYGEMWERHLRGEPPADFAVGNTGA
jgi:predicted O-linked N-acetylglucosamine transferase (SPINDLY family)